MAARVTGASFPRALRLQRSGDFDRVFAEGDRASVNGLLIVARANGLDHARLGLSVGRKYGPAHRRNRAKRLLRESFRLDRAALPSGFDLVAVPRAPSFPDTLDETRRIFRDAVDRAVRRARRDTP